jgi:FixJ family two-component response regulator
VQRRFYHNHTLTGNGAFMKRSVILVLDADADTAGAVANAAAGFACDVRFVQTSKDFFHFCHEDFEDVAAVVLDVDPGVHGMAILEALDACENTPPIIVVSALEEHRLRSVVEQHGAIACLGKPLSFVRLARAVEDALITAAAPAAPRCDVWGHVTNCGCSCPKTNALRELAARN